ncbi:MAG: hypothetical protein ABEI06_09220 [Halobacteriaceae archaeon]
MTDPSNSIPRSLGTDTKLFGKFSFTDILFALTPGALLLLIFKTIVPSSMAIRGYHVQELGLPLAGIGILCGIILVILTPQYRKTKEWVASQLAFVTSSSTHGFIEAQSFTQVKSIHPEHDIIERTDGSLVGLLEIDPPAMALATEDEWEKKAAAFEDVLNTVIEFPVQIYSTTESFPTDEYLQQYESRLGDADVKRNPALQKLLNGYIDWYRDELSRRQMAIRDHYVIVTVTPADIQSNQSRLISFLQSLPGVGTLFGLFAMESEVEQRAEMLTILETRLRNLNNGLREIPDTEVSRVSANQGMKIIAEFWNGNEQEYRDMEKVLRTNPILRGNK